jgi:HEAT repeat protein
MDIEPQTVGIFTTDANLIIRSWDTWLAQAVGIEPEQARGQSLLTLFPELEGRRMIVRFERVLTEGIVEVLAPTFHHFLIPCPPFKPSKYFDRMQQHVTIAPLRENETIIGTIVTIEDVTTRLEREHHPAEQVASEKEGDRLEALQTLAEEELPSGSEKLLESLGDSSWRIRKTAVDHLARKAGGEEINLLLRALRDEHRNPGVLNSALQVLALSSIDAIEPLADFLTDADDADLRIYAAQALGDQHDARAIPLLIRSLEDENLNVRYHTIESLGKLRAAEAVEALATIAESRDFFLAFPALDALMVIGDSRIAPRLVLLLEDELLCSPATDALGRLGDEEVVAPLVTLLNPLLGHWLRCMNATKNRIVKALLSVTSHARRLRQPV